MIEEPSATAPATRPGRGAMSWPTRVILLLVVVVLAVVGVFVAAASAPRWWAGRIADVADGSLVTGSAAGATCGFAFTALPLLVLGAAVAGGRRRWARVALLTVSLLLAVPNLVTLGVELGSGDAPTAARATLAARAPGFVVATGIAAVLGAAAVVALWGLLAGRRRHRRQLADLRARLTEREARDRPAAQGQTPGRQTPGRQTPGPQAAGRAPDGEPGADGG